MILKQVQDHPDEFLPHKFDGFQLFRGGFDVLRLQRQEGKVSAQGGRMGFIEYNDLRAQAMEASTRKRQEALEKAAVRVVDSMAGRGSNDSSSKCCIM